MVIDYTVLGQTLVVMFLMVLLLVGAIYSRLHWVPKAILIVLSLSVATVSYTIYQRSLGWPVADKMPEKFQLIASVIDEPSNDGKNPGAIYLWVKDYRSEAPRSIKLPYDRATHKKMMQARQKMQEGQSVHMRAGTEKKPKSGGASGSDDTDGKQVLDFVPPPSTLPDKDG